MMTTHITTEAVVDSRPVDSGITVPIRKSMNVDDVDTIKKFMAKPRLVATATWTPASLVGAALFGNMKSFAHVAVSPAFVAKLSGFTGVRYTTNIKVVINATPFQQGKLRLVYYPNGGNTLAKYNAHVSNRISLSQMPGVELTTMQQSAETSVPFLSYQEYYDMVGDRVDPLLFNVHVFAPLENGPNATRPNVIVTVWVWFTDVELFGVSTLEPQSKSSVKGKIRTVAAQEERPLSSWLSATSRLASSMSSVPIISSIAAPTAVWTKVASGLASSFGYSRPIDGNPVRSMAPHLLNSISNADGLNVSSVLALNKDASCRLIDDYSPMGQDEMSVNFIKRQWSFIREFSFAVGSAQGAQLTEQGLGPNIGISPVTNFGQAVTPTEFLSRLTRYYRGGIEICFKFVKTGFHSGTLGFSYAVGNTIPSVTIADTDRLHRTIIDIQDGDSVCLAFPFISSRDWLPCEAAYGRLYVHVVNQLVAPETCPQQILVQMYTRGMEDMEFSAYNHNSAFLPQLETPIVNQGGIQMQGGDVQEDDEIVCEPIGGTIVSPIPNGIQMMDCMSESLTSLLSFLKNGNLLSFYYATGTAYERQNFAFNPSAWTVRGRSPVAVFTEPAYLAGTLSYIKSAFAFQRGGHELNILPQVQDTYGTTKALNTHLVSAMHHSTSTLVYQGDISYGFTSAALLGSAVNLRERVAVNNPKAMNHGRFGLSVTLPYRSLYRVNLIRPQILGSSSGDDQALGRFVLDIQSGDMLMLRPAEDFQLLYWVGVPPMVSV